MTLDFDDWRERMEIRSVRLEASTHYVYRAFDSAGRLLYIGCTVNLPQRMSAHRTSAEWWQFVAEMTTHSFPSRSTALVAEELAIHSEGAYFNRFPGNQFTANTPASVGMDAYRAICDSAPASTDYRDDPRWQEASARWLAPTGDRTPSQALVERMAATQDMFVIECEYEAAA